MATPQTVAVSGPTSSSPTYASIVFVTQVVASVTASPSASPESINQSGSGLSSEAIAGLSLAAGLLVGTLVAFLYLFIQRRQRTARELQRRRGQNRDDEALLPPAYQDQEKTVPLESPLPPPASARIFDWVQKTRAMSMSSLTPSYSRRVQSLRKALSPWADRRLLCRRLAPIHSQAPHIPFENRKRVDISNSRVAPVGLRTCIASASSFEPSLFHVSSL
ncbi:hypothetical protein C8F01DRAFT_224249 [Mycena amicta]|nr:hypothetical protein C8F01DRAFT_224249 [Mycena amicta]